MCIHTYVHTYMHTYIHTYIHAYIHTYIHTYIPGFHLEFFVWGGRLCAKIIVCEACKGFDVPYAHF